jgi:hypothetical protein
VNSFKILILLMKKMTLKMILNGIILKILIIISCYAQLDQNKKEINYTIFMEQGIKYLIVIENINLNDLS